MENSKLETLKNKELKTTAACWQALLDGETLQTHRGSNYKVKLKAGLLVTANSEMPINLFFCNPNDWHIYTPPKWYENIPEGGVFCWVWDADESVRTQVVIVRYVATDSYPYKGVGYNSFYKHAIPLTADELQVFINNIPAAETLENPQS